MDCPVRSFQSNLQGADIVAPGEEFFRPFARSVRNAFLLASLSHAMVKILSPFGIRSTPNPPVSSAISSAPSVGFPAHPRSAIRFQNTSFVNAVGIARHSEIGGGAIGVPRHRVPR